MSRYRVVPSGPSFRVEFFSSVGGWWPIAVASTRDAADTIVAELSVQHLAGDVA